MKKSHDSAEREMAGTVRSSPKDGTVIYRSVGMMFARPWLSISVVYNISTCIMFPSKDLGMLHLCCAIANACVK